jgi:hypothetical protein
VVGQVSIENRSALMPTTAARTLDVSAGGEAGLDWANIGSPTTAQNLSATNIDVDQVVASVSGAVGSVTGAVGSVTGNVGGNVVGSVASVTGNVGGNVTGSVGSVVGNVGGNVTGSVGSVVGAVGSVTGNVGGNVTGSVGSVVGAVGSVTGNVGGNVVGSVGSVTGDIGGLAAGAITDVEDAVWDADLADHLDAGSTGEALSDASAAGDPWATALPGAYGAGTAGHILGTGIPDIAPGSANGLLRGGTNAATSITTALTANIIGNVTGNLSGSVGSVTGNVGGNVVGSVGSVAAGGITAASFAAGVAADAVVEIATGVWASGTRTLTSFGTLVADVATAVWAAATRTLTGTQAFNLTGDITGNLSGSVGSVTGSVGSLGVQAKADVNAEVVDCLNVDTYAEPTGAPPATASIQRKVSQGYMTLRNGLTVTASAKTFLDDGGSAEWAKSLNDNGTTYTEGEGA